MKLRKIDLSQIIAVGHNEGQLGLLIDRGEAIEYIEIPAPKVAYDGLQYVSNFANNSVVPELDRDPTPLRGVLPSRLSRERRFLSEQKDDEETECVIELECCDAGNSEYYPINLEEAEFSDEASSCDQLLNFQVPGYSFDS
ncbi:MAG: hypothetical protein SWJ54_19040 [Cyanobacteriota bacterium]|nr:hypothetical protein [Cyanobacteriota bacterium]